MLYFDSLSGALEDKMKKKQEHAGV